MRNKYLILIVSLQISLNIYAIYTTRHALALDPCATAVPATTATAKAPATASAKGSPTPTPNAPTFAFTGTIQRATEKNNLVIYAAVRDKAGNWLDNYRLKLFHNGDSVNTQFLSTAFSQGETHQPVILGGNAVPSGTPSHEYNYKAAFDVLVVGYWFTPDGDWTVTLTDADGKALSNELTFTIAKDDEAKEVFLEYSQN